MKKAFYSTLLALKRHKPIISIVLGIAFLTLIAYYIVQNIQDFAALRIDNVWLIGALFVSVLIRNFSTGLSMDTVLRPLGVRLTVTESFGLANLTRLLNQILPGKVGVLMRSMYLKKRHNLAYTSFVSSFAASQTVLYLLSSVMGIASIFVLQISGVNVNEIFLFILLGATVALSIILLIPDRFRGKVKNAKLAKMLSGWYDIRKDSGSIWSLVLWSLVFIASSTIILYASFNSLGANISIWVALFFSSINIINALIAITPAGFGISEAIIVLLAHSMGIPTTVGLAAALLQRVVTFFAVLIVAPYFSQKLFNSSPWELLRKRFKQSD